MGNGEDRHFTINSNSELLNSCIFIPTLRTLRLNSTLIYCYETNTQQNNL